MNELTQAEIEQHNRRDLFNDVIGCIVRARELLEQAQGTLDDLRPYEIAVGDFVGLIEPHVAALLVITAQLEARRGEAG